MFPPKEKLCLESPAKINLRLEVLHRREDGYHEIRTLFQKIDLSDTLYFTLRPRKGIRITTSHPGLPTGKRNLVYQAIQTMFEESHFDGGVEVLIKKRIPLGAGLGGGSSNAATALKACNQLLGTHRTREELMEIGAKIGADVPFFLFEGSAIGTGIGERLRKIELPVLWFLLIYPNFEVSTRWAYQNLILTKIKYHINLQKLLKSPEGVVSILLNDLEEVVSRRYPEIALMKEMLVSVGARGASMTGSGPTVFGLFYEEEKATEAYEQLKRRIRVRGWKIFLAHSIS